MNNINLSGLPNDIIIYIETFLMKDCENCKKRIYLCEEIEDVEWTFVTIMDDYWFEGCNREIIKGCLYCER